MLGAQCRAQTFKRRAKQRLCFPFVALLMQQIRQTVHAAQSVCVLGALGSALPLQRLAK